MTTLTKTERNKLATCEELIQQSADEMVAQLKVIRDERLYRADHATFEEYCQSRWNMTRQHVNNLISHKETIKTIADTAPNLETIVSKMPETATREIRDLPVEAQAEIVEKVVESGQKPTAKNVKAAREKVTQEKTAPEPQASIVRDGAGREVPDDLSDEYAMAATLVSIGTKFDQIKKAVAQITNAPGAEFIDVQGFNRDLKKLKDALTQERYFTSCVRCKDGQACDLCETRRWFPHSRKGLLSQREKDVIASGVTF